MGATFFAAVAWSRFVALALVIRLLPALRVRRFLILVLPIVPIFAPYLVVYPIRQPPLWSNDPALVSQYGPALLAALAAGLVLAAAVLLDHYRFKGSAAIPRIALLFALGACTSSPPARPDTPSITDSAKAAPQGFGDLTVLAGKNCPPAYLVTAIADSQLKEGWAWIEGKLELKEGERLTSQVAGFCGLEVIGFSADKTRARVRVLAESAPRSSLPPEQIAVLAPLEEIIVRSGIGPALLEQRGTFVQGAISFEGLPAGPVELLRALPGRERLFSLGWVRVDPGDETVARLRVSTHEYRLAVPEEKYEMTGLRRFAWNPRQFQGLESASTPSPADSIRVRPAPTPELAAARPWEQ